MGDTQLGAGRVTLSSLHTTVHHVPTLSQPVYSVELLNSDVGFDGPFNSDTVGSAHDTYWIARSSVRNHNMNDTTTGNEDDSGSSFTCKPSLGAYRFVGQHSRTYLCTRLLLHRSAT